MYIYTKKLIVCECVCGFCACDRLWLLLLFILWRCKWIEPSAKLAAIFVAERHIIIRPCTGGCIFGMCLELLRIVWGAIKFIRWLIWWDFVMDISKINQNKFAIWIKDTKFIGRHSRKKPTFGTIVSCKKKGKLKTEKWYPMWIFMIVALHMIDIKYIYRICTILIMYACLWHEMLQTQRYTSNKCRMLVHRT